MWNGPSPARSRIALVPHLAARRLLSALLAVAFTGAAVARAAVPSSTTLTLSKTTIAAPAAVTLTAAVSAAGVPVTAGSIVFCDATAALCEDAAIVGTAQLTLAGTANLTITPAIGVHSYKAVFSDTALVATSSSAAQALTVTGLSPTSTAIAATGNSSGYDLIATVVGMSIHPPLLTGTVSFNDTTNANSLLGTASLGAPSFSQSFTPATGSPVNTGINSSNVAAADFNGDGKPDLAVVAFGENNITISLGIGDGTFTAGAKYAFETNPCINFSGPSNCSLTTGDFNHDGKVDLVASSGGDNAVVVLLGNGDGTFAAAVGSPIAVGNNPNAVKVADFNGDGFEDLAVANGADNSVSILLGIGDGTFVPAIGSPYTVGNFPFFLAVGNFGNGHIDIAVTNENDQTVSILLGNGDGTFTSGQTVPSGNYNPGPVITADFNGDGKVDLAVANFTAANPSVNIGNVVVLQGNGDGTFAPFPQSPIAVGFQPFALSAVDFNQDGKTDLAVVNYGDQTLTLLLGDGTGGFAPAGAATPLGNSPNDIAAADFNGDGTTDLAIAQQGDNNTAILLNHFYQTATATLPNVTVAGAGTHYVDATYPGNTYFAPSTSATIPLIGLAVPTTLTLTANPAQQLVTMPVTFTAQLTYQPVSGSPTGSVAFFDGGALIGTGAINLAGQAAFTTANLAAGVHTITASYAGDPGFLASTTAAALSITISDLQMTRSGTGTPIVLPGTTVTYSLKVAPLVANTFLYDVTFSASTLPPAMVAVFSTPALSAGSGPATVTMTLQKATSSLAPSPFDRLPLALGLLLPLLGVGRVRRRLRRLPRFLGMLLLAALSLGAVSGLSGCGGAGIFAARKIPYTVTVIATEGTVQRFVQVPIDIQ